jgi:arylsulfatase A-like enzyme
LELRAGQVLLAAFAAGLLSGGGEALLQLARLLHGKAVIDHSAHLAWMATVGSVAAFEAVALVLIALGRFWRRLRQVHVVAFTLAFLACYSVLTNVPRIHLAADAALAAGVALQLSRWLARDGQRAVRLVRRGALALAPVAVVAGVVGGVWQRVSEARELGRLPTAAAGAPNVLLLILDTVRGESLSLYGYERETTPGFSQLALEGVVFDRAMAPAPWTLASHASMFTGRWPHQISADWLDPLDDAAPVLAEALAGRGYATAGFVSNLVYTQRGWGLGRGFARYEDFPVSVGQVINSFSLGRTISNLAPLRSLIGFHDLVNRKTADELQRSLLRWLDGRSQDRPFFVFVNYFDAHEPLFPPAPWDRKFGPPGVVGPFLYREQKVFPEDRYSWSPARIEAERNAYDGAIAYLDHAIRELLDGLEQRELLDNTLVIITSDHGEQFAERGLLGHGNSLYSQNIQVPLLLRLPGKVPAGVRIGQTVSLADLPGTVLELTGADTGPFPGGSLGRYWRAADAEAVLNTVITEVTGGFSESKLEPIAKGDVRSAIVGRWQYIINGDASEELYDLVTDPGTLRDLAGLPEYADRLAEVRGAFRATWRDMGKRPEIRPSLGAQAKDDKRD